MRKYLPALLLLCCSLPVQAEVIGKVYDGDTVTTVSGEHIRLACIDAPEIKNNRHGKADLINAIPSRDWLSAEVLGENVKIQRITKDLYGRTIARIFLSDGTEVNQLSVKTNHSVTYMGAKCSWAK
jgi:endonuclease YncB( thermonuclease family)